MNYLRDLRKLPVQFKKTNGDLGQLPERSENYLTDLGDMREQ